MHRRPHHVQARRTPLLSIHSRKARRPMPDTQYLQRLPLAGFEHHAARRLWSYLRTGQTLQLARERSNPVDRRAVSITWLGEQLGYLPRAQNRLACELLDRGAEVIARIHTLRETDDPWERIDLDLYLQRAL